MVVGMDWVGCFRIALRELGQLHRPLDEVASSIERRADHRSSPDRNRMDDNILYPLFWGEWTFMSVLHAGTLAFPYSQ